MQIYDLLEIGLGIKRQESRDKKQDKRDRNQEPGIRIKETRASSGAQYWKFNRILNPEVSKESGFVVKY